MDVWERLDGLVFKEMDGWTDECLGGWIGYGDIGGGGVEDGWLVNSLVDGV